MPKPGDEDYKPEDDPQEGAQTLTVEDDEQAAADREVNPEEEEQTEAEFKKLDNTAFAAMRKANAEMKKQLADAQKEREELARLRAQRPDPEEAYVPEQHPLAQRPQRRLINGVPVPETEREWDDLARRNWKLAVDLRSIVNAENVTQQVHQQREASRVMEESKQKVLAKHAELNDASSPKSQIYLQILREHPDYLQQPRGPIYAMREMEDRLEEQGQLGDVSKARAEGVREEAARQSRTAVSASGGKVDTSSAPAKTVTLTKDELEMCEHSGLDPKAYAKQKLAQLNAKKGAL